MNHEGRCHNTQANGLVERANKSLMEGIKIRLGREKAGWVDELSNVLWAHRTLIKMSNGETPFSLTYGSKAVILAEIGMPTYRTRMIREGLNEEEIRLNLDLLTRERVSCQSGSKVQRQSCGIIMKGKFCKDVDTRKHRLLPDGLLPLKGPYDKISKGLAKRVQPEYMAPKGKN
ncbi:reverse transcriptase domain-containing protein [Tanacetum coccineum]